MADRPGNTGHEDTVALPRPPQGPAQGGASSESNGNGKVLPPMPAGEPTANGATAPAAPATPPARPARAAQPRTTRTPAKKAP